MTIEKTVRSFVYILPLFRSAHDSYGHVDSALYFISSVEDNFLRSSYKHKRESRRKTPKEGSYEPKPTPCRRKKSRFSFHAPLVIVFNNVKYTNPILCTINRHFTLSTLDNYDFLWGLNLLKKKKNFVES